MKHALKMASGGMTCIPSLMMTVSGNQVLLKLRQFQSCSVGIISGRDL
jgi:hypothetical protein